jgi:hypothetical protein
MLTCGMMFFSTESWNNGGGGKSTARNKNGEVTDLISGLVFQKGEEKVSRSKITSVDVKPWLGICVDVSTNDNLLRFDAQLALEGGVDYTWGMHELYVDQKR